MCNPKAACAKELVIFEGKARQTEVFHQLFKEPRYILSPYNEQRLTCRSRAAR